MLRRFAPAVLVAVLAAPAFAVEPGVYIQATGGYTMPDSDLELDDLEGKNSGPLPDTDLSLDDGAMAAVAVGYDFGDFRAEGEVAYRFNDWDEATISGFAPTSSVDGDFQSLSLMANAIYELPVGDVVSFYVGAGAGIAAVRLDGEYGPFDVEIETGAVAYQGLAGVEFDLTDHLTLNLGYRLWSCLDTDFDDDWDDENRDDDREGLEGDLSIPFFHTVELGMRYTF